MKRHGLTFGGIGIISLMAAGVIGLFSFVRKQARYPPIPPHRQKPLGKTLAVPSPFAVTMNLPLGEY